MDIIAKSEEILKRELLAKDGPDSESESGASSSGQAKDTSGTHSTTDFFPKTGADAIPLGLIERPGFGSERAVVSTDVDLSQRGEARDIHSYLNLNLNRLVVGGDPDCDISISHPSVARHHALLTRRGNELWVEDLGSVNGTYLNDLPVSKRRLTDGDSLRIGDFGFRFVDRKRADGPGWERALIAVSGDELLNESRVPEDLEIQSPGLAQPPKPRAEARHASDDGQPRRTDRASPHLPVQETDSAPSHELQLGESLSSIAREAASSPAEGDARFSATLETHRATQSALSSESKRPLRAGLGLAAALVAAIALIAIGVTEWWPLFSDHVGRLPQAADSASAKMPDGDFPGEALGPETARTSSENEIDSAAAPTAARAESAETTVLEQQPEPEMVASAPQRSAPEATPIVPVRIARQANPAAEARSPGVQPSISSAPASVPPAGEKFQPAEMLSTQASEARAADARDSGGGGQEFLDGATSGPLVTALLRLQEGDLQASLQLAEEGLAVMPQHDGLQAIQREAKRRLEDRELSQGRLDAQTRKLLVEAQDQRKKLRLTTPLGDNAYETLRRVLALDPENKGAQSGIVDIADDYLVLARQSSVRGRWGEAREYARRGLSVVPSHEGLLAFRGVAAGKLANNKRIRSARRRDGSKPSRTVRARPSGKVAPTPAPPSNKNAAKEANRFVAGLHAKARQRHDEGRTAESRTLVETGLRLAPGHPGLLQLKKELK